MKNLADHERVNEENMETQKKQLFFSKVTAIVCCCILLLHLLAAVLIIPAAFKTLNTIDSSLKELNENLIDKIDVEGFNEAVSNLDSVVKPLADIIEGLTKFSMR